MPCTVSVSLKGFEDYEERFKPSALLKRKLAAHQFWEERPKRAGLPINFITKTQQD